jgi:hypothetical protein
MASLVRRVRELAVVASAVVLLSSPARSPLAQELPTYLGQRAVAGDAHRHVGSAGSHLDLAMQPPTCLPIYTSDPRATHETGLSIAIYRHLREQHYDWANLSHHEDRMTSAPSSAAFARWKREAVGRSDSQYGYCTPTSSVGFPSFSAATLGNWLREPNLATAPPPTCSRAYQTVIPAWNEPLSDSSAAAAADVPGSFAAFSGREYTPPNGSGAHTVAIPPGSTDTICRSSASLKPDFRTEDRCTDETALYRWIYRFGDGVLIRAHPFDGDDGAGNPGVVVRWNPNGAPSERSGFTDRWISGVEVGNAAGGLAWEHSFQKLAELGYRLFPSYGSDLHRLHALPGPDGTSCPGAHESRPYQGAAVCWADDSPGPWSRQGIVEAMRQRRCYYSRSFRPSLEVEACALSSGTCAGPIVQLGGMLTTTSSTVRLHVVAVNDPRNQVPTSEFPNDRRLDRVELVSQSGVLLFASAPASCMRGSGSVADRCDVTVDVPMTSGAVYVRVCEGSAACGTNGPNTVLVSAPIFVNWSSYRTVLGFPASEDHPSPDGVPYVEDNCLTVSNPDQRNSDSDEFGDACDNCPTVANFDQANRDGDSAGDLCDPDLDGDGIPNASDFCPYDAGPNTDVDLDGVSDPCDNCPTIANANQADGNANLESPVDGVGDSCDNCRKVYNPRISASSLPGARTTTGGQLDDDADGFGNACDLDLDQNLFVSDGEYFTVLHAVESQPEKTVTDSSCALYDDNEQPTGDFVRCELLNQSPANGGALLSADDLSNAYDTWGDRFLFAKCVACSGAFQCLGDACPPDADGDGKSDSLDDCPSVPDPDQSDGDADGVGDACDNCVATANPRVIASYLSRNPWATLTGGQRDDDHDGYGNKCDAKFPGVSGTTVSDADHLQFQASSSQSRTLDTCGTTGTMPCAIFDLNELSTTISGPDLGVFRGLTGFAPGPRCADCPLPCTAGASGNCF